MLSIDWTAPWLQDLRAIGQGVEQRMAGDASMTQALNAGPQAAHAGIHFVPQSALPSGMGYEHYMALSGQCPTRENLHDFLNGLCWLRFPLTKKKINQLHAAELVGAGAGKSPPLRGPVRDALTLFDENAAFLLAPPPLWDALIARDWQRLFVELRPLWQEAQLVLFGHALLEKLVYPRKPITAHVYVEQPAINSIAELDAWVAADLSAAKLAGKPFTPLPVLGVPGWWPENEDVSFYDDLAVFRPRR
ncbi:MAG: putative transrane protein [Polaromonas sp.]|nr:putative transrane protein [Polaromonas sp.]